MLSALQLKNDEYYTLYEDIEKELEYYTDCFENKTVYLNCDNPEYSNFWKYFVNNFTKLKLKKLISTFYEKDIYYLFNFDKKISYKTIYDGQKTTKIALKEDGDFRSEECTEILKQSDIIVTNPPFSLFREFIDQLNKYNKKFLIIGPHVAFAYKNVFSMFKQDKISISPNIRNSGFNFYNIYDNSIKNIGARWFTNLKNFNNKTEFIVLDKLYNDKIYDKYDNMDAINIDSYHDIPINYNSLMGVPINFIDKWNKNQFELISIFNNPFINGKAIFKRLIIKKII